MTHLDLIIFERNKVLSFFSITTDQRRELFENEYIQIYGNTFRSPEAFCEWNEVIDIKTKKQVGVMFESFYTPMNHHCLYLLKNENVLWPEEDEAVCLYKQTKDWEIQIGPYLPAYFLKNSLQEYCYLVPDSIPGDCSEYVPQLGKS